MLSLIYFVCKIALTTMLNTMSLLQYIFLIIIIMNTFLTNYFDQYLNA